MPTVLGDSARLHQVLWNLLTNAVKFTDRGGRVEIEAAQRQSFVEIVVADDGEGIEPAFLPHIFEPFRQQDAGAARRHQGLGLGLSIASQLVERHGGSLTAASEGPGRGSRFTVRLPVAALAEAIEPDPEAAAHGAQIQVVVQQALLELPHDLRAAVVLFDIEGRPYKEIADVLGVPEGTVKSRIHRGRSALRESLGQVLKAKKSGELP